MHPLNIIVVGASGDLARKKIFPALFALFENGLLPDSTNFFGFARSDMPPGEFRAKIASSIPRRHSHNRSAIPYIEKLFLERCHYQRGDYDSVDSFLDLYALMREKGGAENSNTLFYLAIPPAIFISVARAIGDAGFVRCGDCQPWSRVVVEKPFGRDRESSDKLVTELGMVFPEEQVYRIDHYLGKEVVQNLLTMRFANQIFNPIWNAEYIRRVDIVWQEDQGTAGRGGYFDHYGIVRDVIQNHLLQILALTAMEEPDSLSARDIRDRKVEVLRHMPVVSLDDISLGQYVSADGNEGYTDDPTVPDDSITPTFAEVRLKIDNPRWRGVPFTIKAGKALNRKVTEVRIKFKPAEENIFCDLRQCPPPNELIIRIQPDEGIYFQIINKRPGLKMRFEPTELALSYKSAYSEHPLPEAYECLLLDVIEDDKSLFIRQDELAAAWDIFTPALHEIEKRGIKPQPYPFGSFGPSWKPAGGGVVALSPDDFVFFSDARIMRSELRDLVFKAAAEAVSARGVFSLVVSGGSTPIPFFELMASSDFANDFPWDSTHVFWADERCVGPDDENSNFGVCKKILLDKVDIPAENIHRVDGLAPPEMAADKYENDIKEFFAGHPATAGEFDLVLLGMGNDGHTASLFPGSPALELGERLVVAVAAPETAEPRLPRVTMTYPAIAKSRAVCFLVEGGGKADLIKRFGKDSEVEKPPAFHVESSGYVKWLVCGK